MTANHKEEQRNELEALLSIYPDELTVLDDNSYQVTLKASDSDQHDELSGCRCVLHFRLPDTYPDTAALVSVVEEPDTCEPVELEQMAELLQQEADASLGMCSVFTVVSAGIEWLNQHSDQLLARKERERERAVREKEEAERKRFEGTRVTVETFMKWKQAFEAEMFEARREKERALDAQRKGKLSGFELFTKDSSLIDSDIKFCEEAGEEVVVDEALFQELDGLDLDDEQVLLEDTTASVGDVT